MKWQSQADSMGRGDVGGKLGISGANTWSKGQPAHEKEDDDSSGRDPHVSNIPGANASSVSERAEGER